MPYILLTNDDGITAPGLRTLHDLLSPKAEVVVVAPDRQRSATSHALTLSEPLRARKVKENGQLFGYAVSGTPVDCVKLAHHDLLDRLPDLVISGINYGSNTGINALYSGTLAAAVEGTILGIPSIAVSLTTFRNANFEPAARFTLKLIPHLLERGLPKGITLNINVPNVPTEELQGVRVTIQGNSIYDDHYDARKDPMGQSYYWLTGTKINDHLSLIHI